MYSRAMLVETWQFWVGIAAFFIISIAGIWLSKKRQDTLASAMVRFKFLTIAFGVLVVSLMTTLPPIGSWVFQEDFRLKSLEEAATYQQQLGLALYRIREILQWALQFLIFWLFALFSFLKVLVTEHRRNL